MGKIALAVFVSLLLVSEVLAQPPKLTTVRVGEIGILSDIEFYWGMEKGYYKERGIELKLARFASAAVAMAPLAAGELDVAGGGISVGTFNAFARGFPVKIVAARARSTPANDSNLFMVRTDLRDQIRRAADLKGRKFAINAAGSPLTYQLGKAMESDGLTIKDVDLIIMPWPDMGVAFRNKAIDVGIVIEPFPARFEQQGVAYVWKSAADFVKPDMEVAVLFYNKDWAEKNPQVAKDFMVAYLKSLRAHYEALVPGKIRDEVVEITTRHTPIKDKATIHKMRWSFADPNGTVGKESIKDQQEWYFRNGFVPKKADIDQLIDESYLKYALDILGPYRPR